MAASFLAESITSNIKFTAKVPLLLKATSNDEEPTQGFILQDISNISKSSLPNCLSLLNFLLGRLEKKHPHIKFKVLHLMKYLVINGHSEFRCRLRRNAETVKKTASFRGEWDLIHGDGLNMKVRQAAAELEKLLFDVDNPEVDKMCQSMSVPGQSGKTMEGFGNNLAPPRKNDLTFMETFKKVKESIPSIGKYNSNPSQTSSWYKASLLPQEQYTPVRLTPLEEDDGTEHGQDSCKMSSEKQSFGNLERSDDEVDDDCRYYERKLVDNITAEGGVGNMPSKEALRDFYRKSSFLNPQVILELLDEKLLDSSRDVQLKALCVIEYVLRCNRGNISSLINNYCSTIRNLVGSDDATVRAKAKKISLTVASCLKQDNSHDDEDAGRAPPSYEHARELPELIEQETEACNNKDTAVSAVSNGHAQIESLFSGMNVSQCSSVMKAPSLNPVANQASHFEDIGNIDAEHGTPVGFDANHEPETSEDIFDPLVNIEDTGQPRRGNSHVDHPSSTKSHDSENLFDLTGENLGTISRANVDNLAPKRNLFMSSTLLDSIPGSSLSLPHTAHVAACQLAIPLARGASVPGGLVLTTNASSSSSERRPFPKDMKQEVAGFGFIRKSSKQDAFSFVSDEIAAHKPKPK